MPLWVLLRGLHGCVRLGAWLLVPQGAAAGCGCQMSMAVGPGCWCGLQAAAAAAAAAHKQLLLFGAYAGTFFLMCADSVDEWKINFEGTERTS